MTRTLAITRRVLGQLRRDHRTLALVMIVPALTMLLIGTLVRNAAVQPAIAVAGPPASVARLTVALDVLAGADAIVAQSADEVARLVDDGDVAAGFVLSETGGVELVLDGTVPGIGQRLGRVALAAGLLSAADPDPAELAAAQPAISWVRGEGGFETIDAAAPAMIAFFSLFFVFLLTSVSFLRERTGGTLERIMATPARRRELVGGYVLGFGVLALVQGAIITGVAVWGLGIRHEGPIAAAFPLVALISLVSVVLGIFLSAFSRTELQAIQFIPIVITPQALLSGVVWPIESLPGWLQPIAHGLPLTYGVDALERVLLRGEGLLSMGPLVDALALLAFASAFAALAIASIRREVA